MVIYYTTLTLSNDQSFCYIMELGGDQIYFHMPSRWRSKISFNRATYKYIGRPIILSKNINQG